MDWRVQDNRHRMHCRNMGVLCASAGRPPCPRHQGCKQGQPGACCGVTTDRAPAPEAAQTGAPTCRSSCACASAAASDAGGVPPPARAACAAACRRRMRRSSFTRSKKRTCRRTPFHCSGQSPSCRAGAPFAALTWGEEGGGNEPLGKRRPSCARRRSGIAEWQAGLSILALLSHGLGPGAGAAGAPHLVVAHGVGALALAGALRGQRLVQRMQLGVLLGMRARVQAVLAAGGSGESCQPGLSPCTSATGLTTGLAAKCNVAVARAPPHGCFHTAATAGGGTTCLHA